MDNGWNAQYGARPLKRAIQRHVEDLLSDEIINGNIRSGSRILLTVNDSNTGLAIQNLDTEAS